MLTGHIVPSLKVALLIGIRPLCKAGCKVVFDNEKCEVIFNNKVILTGHKDPSMDLWTLPLPTGRMWTSPTSDAVTTPTLPRPGPCIDRAPHPPKGQNQIHPGVNVAAFTHLVRTRANTVIFAHQSLCSPKISLLLKAVRWGFSKGCPNMKETFILKYLNPTTATAKGHMKRPRQGIRSTWPKVTHHAPTARVLVPIIEAVPVYVQPHIPDPTYPGPAHADRMGPHVVDDHGNESIANIFCFGAFADKKQWHRIPRPYRVVPIHAI
jgi:hypothetical protein